MFINNLKSELQKLNINNYNRKNGTLIISQLIENLSNKLNYNFYK